MGGGGEGNFRAARIFFRYQILCMNFIKGRTIRKLITGVGAGEVQKKIFAQGKIKGKKIHARKLTLKDIHATA